MAPFLYLFQKKRVRGECWVAGRFFCSFSWFSGSLDPPSAAACAVQSQFFMFGVALEIVSFLHTFCEHFGVIWAHLFMFFGFLFQSLILSAKWEARRGLGWAGLAPQNKAPRVLGVRRLVCGRTNKHPAVPEHNLCISRLGNSRSQASSAASQPGGTP